MTLSEWVTNLKKRWDSEGITGLRLSVEELWWGVLRRTPFLFDEGFDIEEKLDADIIIILDACRADLLQSVTHEYDWLPSSIDTGISPASHSREFSEELSNASADWLASTAFFSTNDHPDLFFGGDEFYHYELLSDIAWDSNINRTHPEVVTDHGIHFWREHGSECDRMILWYLFPHAPLKPFLDDDRFYDSITFHESTRDNVWHLLRTGILTHDEVWEGYLENLRWVLDYVEILKDNLDGSILITADHGNAFGEYNVYGHPSGVPISPIRRVPLAYIDGTDSGTYTPTLEEYDDGNSTLDERLKALGYK